MSWASNPDSSLSDGWLSSAYPGLGILGSAIPTAGDNGGSPVLNDGISAGKEYRWALVTPPASGTTIPTADQQLHSWPGTALTGFGSSTLSVIGIVTWSSAAACHAGLSPEPSVPSSSATRPAGS